jgi:hypothetical protein
MKRRLSALFVLLLVAACDTTNANDLMFLPGPWVTPVGPSQYEIVVRKLWGVAEPAPEHFRELQLKALRLGAETARDKGTGRFTVLRVKREAVKRKGGWDLNWPLIRMNIRLLEEGEAPPEGKPLLLSEETIRQVNEKLN